jgi:glycine/D-amino acid oxidase-like deaminating enzyme
MSDDNHYDVIIIGTGAGGGTLAYKLAPSGIGRPGSSCLMLPWRPGPCASENTGSCHRA